MENNSTTDQPLIKVDHADLLKQIIAADDGREPMDKARHNLVDPSPLEVMDFVCAYADEADQKLERFRLKMADLQSVLHYFVANINDENLRQHLLKEIHQND